MKILIPGQPPASAEKLLALDEAKLLGLCARQMLVRPDHRGLAEFPIDPSRPEVNIGGSVLAFNPEVQHDEAVGLKMVSLGENDARTGLSFTADQAGLVAHMQEGQPFGMYLFTPTPNTAGAATRFSEVCLDGGRMVQVSGIRRRSLVCAVRLGSTPIASDGSNELPVPFMTQRHGFPRAFLASSKRQRPGLMMPGPRGFEPTVQVDSAPLVFGQNVADETALTVAVLEYLEHDELETGPVDLRPNIAALLHGSVQLQDRPVTPKNLVELQSPSNRLLTGMRVTLRKAPDPAAEDQPELTV